MDRLALRTGSATTVADLLAVINTLVVDINEQLGAPAIINGQSLVIEDGGSLVVEDGGVVTLEDGAVATVASGALVTVASGGGLTVASGGILTLAAGALVAIDAIGTIKDAYTSAAAASGTVRSVYGVTSIGAALTWTSGNLVGVRGEANMPAGTTVGGGVFMYGAQGKFIAGGTMNHADARITGVLAQLDISVGTFTTGQISALWADCGATASASAVSTKGGGQFYIGRFTNTTAASCIAGLFIYTDADFLFDLGGPGGNADWFATAGTPTTNAGWLKVQVNGSTRYIALFSAPS